MSERTVDLEQVRGEIRESIEKGLGEGYSLEVIHDDMVKSLKNTYQLTEMKLMMEIMFNPEAGFSFAYNVHQTIEAVNSVANGEYGMETVDIKDFGLATVKTIEQVTERSIYDILEEIDKHQKGLH